MVLRPNLALTLLLVSLTLSTSIPVIHPPIGNLCGTSSQPRASAHAALAQWTKAGMPASKLLLGLALYGYVSKSTAKKLSGSLMPDPSVNPSPHPRSPLQDTSTAPAGDLSSMWGQQVAFKQLVRSGALVKTNDGYKGANGYTMGKSIFVVRCTIYANSDI